MFEWNYVQQELPEIHSIKEGRGSGHIFITFPKAPLPTVFRRRKSSIVGSAVSLGISGGTYDVW